MQRLADEGTDYSQFIRDLLRHLRQLFLLQHLEDAASDAATLRTLGQTVELDGELFREQLQRAGQVSPREVVFFIERLGARPSARSATGSTRGFRSSSRWSK